jgi:branched-chain amino acid transport system substrate-binding protein
MKKAIWVVIVLFFAGFSLVPRGGQTADVVKLGLVTPLSAPGDYESGQINVKTAELAVDELNQKGGILGKKVILVKADDEGKPAVGVTAVQRMIANDKVSAIVGAWHSSVALAQAKVSDRMGVPMFFHYSWTDDLTAQHSDYIFRVSPFNSEIAALLVPFLIGKGYKNIAVMHETTAYGTGFADALAKLAGERGINVTQIGFPAEAQDLKPQLLELKSMKPRPELLVVSSVYQAMYLVPKQAHEIGLAPETEVLAGWDYPGWSPEWWEVMGDKGVGVMYPTFSCAKLTLTSLGEHFKKAFVARYEFDPPIYAYFLYDEVMIIADAMERTKSSDPKKLAEALTTTRFDGTTGVITFDREEGPVWNQWMGHQLFVLQLTEPNQKGKDAAVIYP